MARLVTLGCGATMVALSACSAATGGSTTNPRGTGGKGDQAGAARADGTPAFEHRWAVDLRKVREVLPRLSGHNERLVSANQATALGPGGTDDEQAQKGAIFRQACEPEKVIGPDGSVTDGECLLWGNTARLEYDHSRHVDDAGNAPLINFVETDGSGEIRTQIDPPGYLNIIALKNADIHQQDEITEHLRNGDILVYFHPEEQEVSQFRHHHAAMFYNTSEGPVAVKLSCDAEQGLNGVVDEDGQLADSDVFFMHHIDNPVSYGPQLNAGPGSRPFHVYRFHPNGAPGTDNRDGEGFYRFPCTDNARDFFDCEVDEEGDEYFRVHNDMVEQYRLAMRNWALVANGRVPFAGFHSLPWQDAAQRANADLAIGNAAFKDGGICLQPEWAGSAECADGWSAHDETGRWAKPLLGDARPLGGRPKAYCAGLVFTNMNLGLNYPFSERALGDEVLGPLFDEFRTTSTRFDDGYMKAELPGEALAAGLEGLAPLGHLAFEPITPSDVVIAWLEGYFHQLPRPFRGYLLMQTAPKIARSFRSLEWAAVKVDSEDADGQGPSPDVADPRVVATFGMAYGGWTDAIKLAETASAETIRRFTAAVLAAGLTEMVRSGEAPVPIPEAQVPMVADLLSGSLARELIERRGSFAGAGEQAIQRLVETANMATRKTVETLAQHHPGLARAFADPAREQGLAFQVAMAIAGAGLEATQAGALDWGDCNPRSPSEWRFECMRQLEKEQVRNRYVPPFVFHRLANTPGSTVSYVGTVLHEDLLTCLPGNDCTRGTGTDSSIMVGGPDTSEYANYFVPDGDRMVQRVLDVTSGTRVPGRGTSVMVRYSAADHRDMRAILHPPGSFTPFETTFGDADDPNHGAYCADNDGCLDDRGPAGQRAPGIYVPIHELPLTPPDAAVEDVLVEFELFTAIEEGGLGCDLETRECPSYDWETGRPNLDRPIHLDQARGQWALTLVDRGQHADGAAIPLCDACSSGGGHANQWRIVTGNRARCD